MDKGKLDREQSLQDFASRYEIVSNKESKIEMARVLREKEIRNKQKILKEQVDRKE